MKETEVTENIEEALRLYRDLAEEMKHPVFAMQTLAEFCDEQTLAGLRQFIALCRRTRSTPCSSEGRAIRTTLKQADRAIRRN